MRPRSTQRLGEWFNTAVFPRSRFAALVPFRRVGEEPLAQSMWSRRLVLQTDGWSKLSPDRWAYHMSCCDREHIPPLGTSAPFLSGFAVMFVCVRRHCSMNLLRCELALRTCDVWATSVAVVDITVALVCVCVLILVGYTQLAPAVLQWGSALGSLSPDAMWGM